MAFFDEQRQLGTKIHGGILLIPPCF